MLLDQNKYKRYYIGVKVNIISVFFQLILPRSDEQRRKSKKYVFEVSKKHKAQNLRCRFIIRQFDHGE